MIKVICGFKGIGKTHLVNSETQAFHELDTIQYDRRNKPWEYFGDIIKYYSLCKNGAFPNKKYLLLPCDKEMFRFLQACDIDFCIAAPRKAHRAEYMERFKGFSMDLTRFWHEWDDIHDDIREYQYCEKKIIKRICYVGTRKYLSDHIEEISTMSEKAYTTEEFYNNV